ncbi:glycosyltransferase [Empedobacter falsenii]|uniref:glycosyltransferase n=1 Tax=Empedobacter falsenii TaxID=343874 RepID=UPI003A810942
MKVLFIINDLNSGGIENYLLRFLRYYNKKITPVVLCKSGNRGVLEKEYQKIDNIEIVSFKISFLDLKGIRNFKRLLKDNNFTTVVDFTGNFAGIPMFISYRSGIKKRITFYRGATNHFKENNIRLAYNSLINKLVLKYATSILSNSKAAFKFFFKDKVDNRFEVIYNGIDAEKFLNCNEDVRKELNIPEEAFVIGHVGRYAREKNHEAVFEVARKLCPQHNDIYFILCGKGVDEAFAEKIKDLKLSNQIITLGYRSDVVKVLNSMNAFYFPSFSEGQPNALIEALIAGLPFVASDIDPILETIPKSHYSFLTSPEDTQKAVDILMTFYNNKNSDYLPDLKNWAIKNYNPHILFQKFYNKL